MSSSLCQYGHPLVPLHLEVLYVLPSYFLLPQSWNLCYLNSSLQDFMRFRSVLSSPLFQDSAFHDEDWEEGLPPQPQSWLFSRSQHRQTCASVRASACWHFSGQNATPQEAGVSSGGDVWGWLLAMTEFPPVVYNRWQLGNSVSCKTGWSCLTLKLWSRISSWGLWKHNKLHLNGSLAAKNTDSPRIIKLTNAMTQLCFVNTVSAAKLPWKAARLWKLKCLFFHYIQEHS